MPDDFKTVSYKRPRKPPKPPISEPLHPTPTDAISRRIHDAKTELQQSDLFASAVASLREGISTLSNPEITEIICLGLGRISECTISRYQFAFLLCLKELYNVEAKIYDPVFTKLDLSLIEHHHCLTIKENFRGKFKICDNKTRIFYLPHCPKQLSNNLLWANWGLNLNYCVVVANSFNTIFEKTPKRILNKSANFISRIIPHIVELPLINSFRLFEIFNDTAIHVFPLGKLSLLTPDFWVNSEPVYSEEEF